jgi:transposase
MGVVMAEQRWVVSDQFWERVEPLLPAARSRRFDHPGRLPADDRLCLEGIMYVLVHGVPWDQIPREDGRPAGITCYKRMRAWTDVGVWQSLHAVVIAELVELGLVDLDRALVDSSDAPAKKGARKPVAASNSAAAWALSAIS